MNGDAIVMMLVAMLIIWGGLGAALLNLRRSTDLPTREEQHRDL